jgi:hypothetical protein
MLREPSRDARATAARWLSASPEFVYQEMKQLSDTNQSVYLTDNLYKLLVLRNNRLINLAVAKFGTEQSVIKELYNASSVSTDNENDRNYHKAIRLACLSNLSLGGGYDFKISLSSFIDDFHLKVLFSKGAADEWITLLENPSLSLYFFEILYTKTDFFSTIDIVTWTDMVSCTGRNKVINFASSDDGYKSLSIKELYKQIFAFFKMVPAVDKTVYSVLDLLRRLNPWQCTRTAEVKDVINKWMNATLSDSKNYYGELDVPVNQLIACYVAALFGVSPKISLPMSVQRLSITDRCAYYASNCTKRIPRWGEKDREVFMFASLKNTGYFYDGDGLPALENRIFARQVDEFATRCKQSWNYSERYDGRKYPVPVTKAV